MSGIDGKGDAVAMDGGEVEGAGVGMRLTESGWGAWSGTEARKKMGVWMWVEDKVGCLVNKITSIREEF